MRQTYVALDLETTGLAADLDAIIEVGAVKFRDGGVVDTFQSLVNPGRRVPYRIRLLCGIEEAELAAAPPFSDVAVGLGSFVGDSIVVGHNIVFDLTFLAHNGLTLANPTCDTWELATTLLFQQPDYSLSTLARELGLSAPEHRALPDATAAMELLLALTERALDLDLRTLEELVMLADRAEWGLGHYFRDILTAKAKSAFQPASAQNVSEMGFAPPGEERLERITPQAERTPLDLPGLSDILEDGGLLARALSGFEHRAGQVQMMQAVAQAYNDSEHLIVEAGTGTGKSIAYLLPSMVFALDNGLPVVVSTNTLSLQGQLMGKDIPDLLRALEPWRDGGLRDLTVVQLKGRTNYLCLKKYDSLKEAYRLSLDEVRVLARITVWLRSTTTGDRAELSLGGDEFLIWDKLCAQFDQRLQRQCAYHQNGTCFLYRARRAAENAHLIVTNHALLLSDMAADGTILPDYSHLVVDEAHHLEGEATNQLSARFTQWDLLDHLNRLTREVGEQARTGLVVSVRECFRGSTVAAARQRQLKQLAEALGNHVERARSHLVVFLDRVRDFVQVHTREAGEYDRHLLLTWDKRSQPGWSRVEIAWEDLDSTLKEVGEELERLYLGFEDLNDSRIAGYDYLMLELSSLFARNNELRQGIGSLVSQPGSDSIYWITLGGQANSVRLHTAPLDVAPLLEKTLFSARESVVLTGATLSTEGTFEYLKGRVGVDDARELLLGTPFDYPSSTMVYLPHDIPEPGAPGYQQALHNTLADMCRATRGHALVLFTSHAALRATQVAIQGPLEQEGILVLAHGVDGAPKQLLSAFRSNPETVLLGTASFWEGIDVIGDALSVLVIARLPFNVPTDPIFAARCGLFDDPFNQYAIPQAAIRFKQGFGRLIRSSSDRGVVVIFDKRVQTKRYGSAFMDSIPLCTVVKGPAADLPSAAVRWLGRPE